MEQHLPPPESCASCPHHMVLPDPDPHDSFCADDAKIVCMLAKRDVAVAVRPTSIQREATRPVWCPLTAQANSKKGQSMTDIKYQRLQDFAGEWITQLPNNDTLPAEHLANATLGVSQYPGAQQVITDLLKASARNGQQENVFSIVFDFAFGVGRMFERSFQSLSLESEEERSLLRHMLLHSVHMSDAYNPAETEIMKAMLQRLAKHPR